MERLKANQQEGGYIPTSQDKERIRMPKEGFLLSGDGVFHTIQGEGNYLGQPTTFVRLHHCNLECTWCDAYYTWKQDTPEFYQEPYIVSDFNEAIIAAQQEKGVEKLVPRLVFTGGEPLLQQNKIVDFLNQHPIYFAEIETNGTIMPRPSLMQMARDRRVKFNCSPKLDSSGNAREKAFKPGVLQAIASTPDVIFKFVCATREDINEVLDQFSFLPLQSITIMAEGVTKEDNARVYDEILPYILQKGLNTHPRFQNVLFDGAKRGV